MSIYDQKASSLTTPDRAAQCMISLAERVSMDRNQIFQVLNTLTEPMFKELVFRLDAPTAYFPGPNTPLAERVIALVDYCDKQTVEGLPAIVRILKERFPFVLHRVV
jgi:hypothetical protein